MFPLANAASAASDLPAPLQSALVMGLVIAAIFTFSSFVLIGLQIWNLLRPKTDLFVTRSEFESLRSEISTNRSSNEKHFAEIGTKQDNTQNSMNALSNDLMRAIGQIEGRISGGHA